MKHEEKYSSIPAEYREPILRALSKPANKRTEIERQTIDLGEQWIALKNEEVELTRQTEEMKRETKELQRERDGYIAELVAEAHKLWIAWEAVAREELAKTGFDVEGKHLDALQYGLVSAGADNSPAGRLIGAIWQARQSECKQSPELGFMSGLAMASALVKMGRTKLLESALSVIQSKRSKRPRSKPLLGTRAIAIAWEEGHRDTASIRDFFNDWRGKLDDEWGGMSLDTDDEDCCWWLIDEGGKRNKDGKLPSKQIRFGSLASLVSRFRKDQTHSQ